MLKKSAKKARFHRKLYPEEAVEKARNAFAGVASIDIKKNGSYFDLTLKDSGRDIDEGFIDEFANYVLAEAKKCL